MRPKTADRNERLHGGKTPKRQVYSPVIAASSGLNHSPYQVPNVAVIPSPKTLSKQVSFAGN